MNKTQQYIEDIPGKIPIKIRRVVQLSMDLHWHDFNELVIVATGKGEHFTIKESFPINIGDVFFIKPGILHGYRKTKNLELINILFYPGKAAALLETLKACPGYRALFDLEPDMRDKEGFTGKLTLPLEELDRLQVLIKAINNEMTNKNDYGNFMAITYFLQLILTLARYYEIHKNSKSEELLRMGNIFTYLENNFQENITLNSIAERFHVSKSTLIRNFKRITGIPPLAFLLKIRIANASEILKKADSSVIDAALASGFSDSNYFSRQFKKHTGLAPKEFKKLYSPRPV